MAGIFATGILMVAVLARIARWQSMRDPRAWEMGFATHFLMLPAAAFEKSGRADCANSATLPV
jgi:hypothetical protein